MAPAQTDQTTSYPQSPRNPVVIAVFTFHRFNADVVFGQATRWKSEAIGVFSPSGKMFRDDGVDGSTRVFQLA